MVDIAARTNGDSPSHTNGDTAASTNAVTRPELSATPTVTPVLGGVDGGGSLDLVTGSPPVTGSPGVDGSTPGP